MTPTEASSETAAERRARLEAEIIGFIAQEIQDKTAVLTRETRRDEVAIDSIDIVNVVFAVEEKYDTQVDIAPDSRFETVGDLIDKLITFIPDSKP